MKHETFHLKLDNFCQKILKFNLTLPFKTWSGFFSRQLFSHHNVYYVKPEIVLTPDGYWAMFLTNTWSIILVFLVNYSINNIILDRATCANYMYDNCSRLVN